MICLLICREHGDTILTTSVPLTLTVYITMAEDEQNAEDPLISDWLTDREETYPRLLHGGTANRFRAVVNSYRAFSSILKEKRYNQPTDDQTGGGGTDTNRNQNSDRGEVDGVTVSVDNESEGLRGFLHEITKLGCCETLRDLLGNGIDVDETDDNGITALHIAADYNYYENMKILLEAGAEVKIDRKGLTPLHLVASSAQPNSKIAEMLIEYMTTQQDGSLAGQNLLNAKSCGESSESTNGNTALHFAAENHEVSIEFIRALKDISPSIKNHKGETAFHIAARLENPEVIVSMLEVFFSAEEWLKMSDLDSGPNEGQTLLEICARKGNAKAVGRLIKYGADISKKVLFDIIDESVSDPTKQDSLIDVYRTITDTCVLCEWRKSTPEERRSYPRRGTQPNAYGKKQGEIMLKLLTVRDDSLNRNVIEHAIAAGAEALLCEMLNTANVFKITTDERGVLKYDVTDFLLLGVRAWRRSLTDQSRTDSESQSFIAHRHPAHRKSYLYRITQSDLWKKTDILDVEPFLSIAQPIYALVKLLFFVITLIQLAYMIGFSFISMPSYCSSRDSIVNSTSSRFIASVQCHPSTWHYVLLASWPTCMYCSSILEPQIRTKCKITVRYFFTTRSAFVIITYLWIFLCRENVVFFISVTSVMHLFGWLFTLALFIHSSEKVCVFLFLVKQIIIEDILYSFGIVFVFVLVGFSSAVHMLRNSALAGNSTYSDTMYNLFGSALTIGDFMNETHEDSLVDKSITFQLQTTFALYLCCATIIMLNILIIMINNRYQKAIKTAKNVWRFHTLETGLHMLYLCPFAIVSACRIYWRIFEKYPRILNVFTDNTNINYTQVSLEEEKDGHLFLILRYSKRDIPKESSGQKCNKEKSLDKSPRGTQHQTPQQAEDTVLPDN